MSYKEVEDNKPALNLVIVAQLFSGLDQVCQNQKWGHSGSPAYFNFIQVLESNKDFSYQLIFLTTSKNGRKGVQYIQLDNLNKPVCVVPYYSIFLSNYLGVVKKIENFYNKLMQYIVVFRLTRSAKNYYVDRDNILLAYFILHIKRAKVIIRILGVNDNLYQYLTTRKNTLSRIIDWVFNHPRVIFICTNDGSYSEIIQRRYKNKFYLLFNGVDKKLKRSHHYGKRKKIVYLSRIIKNKGHADFINGVAQSKVANKLDVKIIGDGYYRQEMELLTSKLNLKDNIHFVGRLDHDDAMDEMSKADLFVSINYSGVFGNVVLEASQMGIPVLVLEHPECPGILYNLLELKRDNKLVENIAKVLRKVVNDEVWLDSVGKRSEQFSSKYLSSWDQRIKSEILIIKRFFSN